MWNVGSKTSNRDPPYLHPDYVAVVEYQEQCTTKEESQVIVLVDSSLPSQRNHTRNRSKSSLPPPTTNGQPPPIAETRRANEWRARPNRSQVTGRQPREQPLPMAAEAPAAGSKDAPTAKLPHSNSDSSVGSGNSALYPVTLAGEDLMHTIQQPFVVDPQLSHDELRNLFIEKEQRRIYAAEWQQQKLNEDFGRMGLGIGQPTQQYGRENITTTQTQTPLTMEHLDLYRNFLQSLEQNQALAPAPNDTLHSMTAAHAGFPSFPGGYNLPISIPPPPSLSNARTEDTHPPSSVLPSPMAPYVPENEGFNYASDIALYPALQMPYEGIDQRGFSTGYLFPAGSLGYSRPPPNDPQAMPYGAFQMQNRWDEKPNQCLPPSRIHYRDPEPLVQDDHHYQTAGFMHALTIDNTTKVQSSDVRRSGITPEVNIRADVSSRSRLSRTTRRNTRNEAVAPVVNDLDVITDLPATVADFPRPRANTLSALSATRGHQTSTAHSLDLGRDFRGPVSTPVSSIGAPAPQVR